MGATLANAVTVLNVEKDFSVRIGIGAVRGPTPRDTCRPAIAQVGSTDRFWAALLLSLAAQYPNIPAFRKFDAGPPHGTFRIIATRYDEGLALAHVCPCDRFFANFETSTFWAQS
jgi:hypothetical protein